MDWLWGLDHRRLPFCRNPLVVHASGDAREKDPFGITNFSENFLSVESYSSDSKFTINLLREQCAAAYPTRKVLLVVK